MKRHLIYHTQVAVNETNSDHSICIKTLNEQSIHTAMQSISRDGLTITCDQQDLVQILPNTSSVSLKQPIQLPVSFTLKDTVEAQCNVVCVRRLSKDIFQVDMRFTNLKTRDEELVDEYVEQSLKLKQNTDFFSEAA